jgi:hypothetical protein
MRSRINPGGQGYVAPPRTVGPVGQGAPAEQAWRGPSYDFEQASVTQVGVSGRLIDAPEARRKQSAVADFDLDAHMGTFMRARERNEEIALRLSVNYRRFRCREAVVMLEAAGKRRLSGRDFCNQPSERPKTPPTHLHQEAVSRFSCRYVPPRLDDHLLAGIDTELQGRHVARSASCRQEGDSRRPAPTASAIPLVPLPQRPGRTPPGLPSELRRKSAEKLRPSETGHFCEDMQRSQLGAAEKVE